MIADGTDNMASDATTALDAIDAYYDGNSYSITICTSCQQPFLFRQQLQGVPGEFEVQGDPERLFPKDGHTDFGQLPDFLSHSIAQARTCLNTGCYDACALMCRRTLEALCAAAGVTGRTLAAKLENLRAEGKIDSNLLTWANGVRHVGNSAAHEVQSVTGREDAQDILEFTEALLIYVYRLAEQFRSFQSRRAGKSEAAPASNLKKAGKSNKKSKS